MISLVEATWSIRPGLRILGVAVLLLIPVAYFRAALFQRGRAWVQRTLDPFCETHWRWLLLGLGLGIFGMGLLAKVSQFYSLQFEAQDFWLFVDLLEQSSRGGIFLTRFAPQAQGFVQHGIVHPNFSYLLLVPFVWCFGPVWTAMLAQALAGALGGIGLAVMSVREWGARNSLLWMLAFCLSSYWGKILMYEVHPEAFYPAFYFFWIAMLQRLERTEEGSRLGMGSAALSFVFLLLLLGVKEDAFLLVLPVLALAWAGRGGYWMRLPKKLLVAQCLVAGLAIAAQAGVIGALRAGTLGPSVWEAQAVTRDFTISFLKGLSWSGAGSAWNVFSAYLADQGGGLGWLHQLILFFLSKPFLSFVVLAPWVVLLPRFWILILPLSAVICVMEGPRILWNYYSAPFLGVLYGVAVGGVAVGSHSFSRVPKSVLPAVALLASLLFGGGGYLYFFPSETAQRLRAQAGQLVPRLNGRGWVASHLIGSVPLENVAFERPGQSGLNGVDFVLLSPGIDRYRLSQVEVTAWVEKLGRDPAWQRQAVSGDAWSESDKLVFFKRK